MLLMEVEVEMVVEMSLGIGELKEGTSGAPEGAEIEGVGGGESVPCVHQLLHVSPPRLASRHCLFFL